MRASESGQAAVESALTLPLVLFMILGTLQLFMLLQGRIMAQYAAYKAVRVGSVNQGSCEAMTHAAIAAVLPTIVRTDTPAALATAFSQRRDNRYNTHIDGTHNGQIIEIVRLSPTPPFVGQTNVPNPAPSEDANDQPGVDNVLAIRMVFWFQLKIPFANWVMSKMLLAHFGIQPYTYANPLLLTQKNANWTLGSASLGTETWPGGPLATNMRLWARQKQYLFPIKVTAAMRMMTPPRLAYFQQMECPLVPAYELR